MKKFKSLTALILAFVMAFSTVAWAAETTPEELGLIPVRALFEGAGGIVTWVYEDAIIHIAIDGGEIIFVPGEAIVYTGGEIFPLETGVIIIGNTAFISQADLDASIAFFVAVLSAAMGIELVQIHLELTEEARDIVLYDFDYLVNLILENSIWDSIIERRMGVNFDDFVAQLRAAIEAMYPVSAAVNSILLDMFPIRGSDDPLEIAADYLTYFLLFGFSVPLMSIGHMEPRDITMYQMLLETMVRIYYSEDMPTTDISSLFIETYTHPQAVWFYGEFEIDMDSDDFPFPQIPDNIVTEILVPGEVAYLGIRSFLSDPDYDDLVTLPFLQEIQDFDNLIIDIRGNLGGLAMYFNTYILRRLISEPTEIASFQFITGGEVALRWAEAFAGTGATFSPEMDGISQPVYAQIIPVADFLSERNMPYLNQSDLERLEYVMVSRTLYHPAPDSINFQGNIWLLVDEFSMSASPLAALALLYADMATIVGENTSGVMGVLHSYSVLPQTGMIFRIDIGFVTDAYGRSLEVYGITPHVRNFPGMDALQTVLALIEESLS